ncbi:VOC family protein [Bordetella hinzii]|uniref:VOC family protein n=1 Tax=Bordetella hinzii TaxID=103855 RepID=UPI001C031FD1|nr:VOC family protein [Bordetella hinzii]QWF37634.1 VOC family protein [Bordetella hinzii]QWF42178.1 VOC family protein [Bordetella hinzii]QWF46720.1 VOC family protein [Bordetella hinzii]QWF51259.1 VOC family protein [Bordetella hinzii]QWF56229.1 VOC family protein [Bordetella hinzii]
MIDHTGITVSDFARSLAFYEAALAPLGYTVLTRQDDAAGLGAPGPAGADPGGDFWLMQGPPCQPRVHMAFRAASRAEVEAFHRAALAAGGRDNGAPGPRPQYHAGYYAAFVHDPDGYNIEAVFHGA